MSGNSGNRSGVVHWLRKSWARFCIKSVHYRNRKHKLNWLYLMPDPWDMESEEQQFRFDETNRVIEQQFGHVGTILELGCGEGHQSVFLRKHCDRLIGTDISQSALQRARRRCPDATFRHWDICNEAAPAELSHVDLVVACEVIYYLPETRKVLERLQSIASEGLITYTSTRAEHLDSITSEMPGLSSGRIELNPSRWWRTVWWSSGRSQPEIIPVPETARKESLTVPPDARGAEKALQQEIHPGAITTRAADNSAAGRKVVPLADGYCAEVDSTNEAEWNQLIPLFDDASLNQTWAFGAVKTGERNVSRLVLRYHEEIVAAAQVRVRTIPLLGMGVAYVSWGPMWMRRDWEPIAENFRQAIRALRNEYVAKRGLCLRLYPLVFDDDVFALREIVDSEMYRPAASETAARTILLDLAPELKTLREGMEYKSRRNLRRAEEAGLDVAMGEGEEMLDSFMEIYREMVSRKGFLPSHDHEVVKRMQERLPAGQKLGVYLCRDEGRLCAGTIVSMLGNTGLEMSAATNDLGMKNSSSYLLRWKMVEQMKRMGQQFFNINGINPEENLGTYQFKRGFTGKCGRDLHYLGKFDATPGALVGAAMRLGYLAQGWEYRQKLRLERWKASRGARKGNESDRAGE